MAKKKAKKQFFPPRDFPKKAADYVKFFKDHSKDLSGVPGHTPKALDALKKEADQVKPAAEAVKAAWRDYKKQRDAYRKKATAGFKKYMNLLKHARVHADDNADELEWFAEALKEFRAHPGNRSPKGGKGGTGLVKPGQ